MAAVEDAVHLLPVGIAFFLNESEQRRHGEHVVLDDAAVFAYKVEDFRLRSTRTMHHAVDAGAHCVEHFLDYGRIGARRR